MSIEKSPLIFEDENTRVFYKLETSDENILNQYFEISNLNDNTVYNIPREVFVSIASKFVTNDFKFKNYYEEYSNNQLIDKFVNQIKDTIKPLELYYYTNFKNSSNIHLEYNNILWFMLPNGNIIRFTIKENSEYTSETKNDCYKYNNLKSFIDDTAVKYDGKIFFPINKLNKDKDYIKYFVNNFLNNNFDSFYCFNEYYQRTFYMDLEEDSYYLVYTNKKDEIKICKYIGDSLNELCFENNNIIIKKFIESGNTKCKYLSGYFKLPSIDI